LSFSLLFSACGTATRSVESQNIPPEWVHQSARTVESGYLVYVASGEDPLPEKARFKAEAQALEDLANECSFAPKGTRIEDRYQRSEGSFHQAFVKIAVEFQLCEEAKAAMSPQEIRRLGNAAFSDELKRYQDLLAQDSGNPMLSQTQPPTLTSASESSGSSLHWVVIRDQPQYWIVRREIALRKQVVILSPPESYPPGSQQTRELTHQLTGASDRIHRFEDAHPELTSTPISRLSNNPRPQFNPSIRQTKAQSPSTEKRWRKMARRRR
jgi:hypothetical protein